MLPITSNHDAAVPAGTNVPVKNQQSCWSVGCHAHLVGEPDAANPHVRFDERGVEPEHGGLLGHRHTKEPATRKATPKPPRHSSTLLLFNTTARAQSGGATASLDSGRPTDFPSQMLK